MSRPMQTTSPSLYRLTRDTFAELFGQELVDALDRVEMQVLSSAPKKLPVVKATASV